MPLIPADIPAVVLLPYYHLIIPHSTDRMREARIQLGMKECVWRREVRRRVYVAAKKNELARLRGEAVAVEADQKCAVCGEAFTKESAVARTKAGVCVHETCLSEEEKEEVVLNDLC